ncbi:MAG: outer membrane beta-barrel protein [Bacteroidota bacterium]
MKLIFKLTFAALLLSSFQVFAQDAAPAPQTTDPFATEPEAEEKEEEEPSFSLTGYVDAYYQANLSSVDGDGDDKSYIPFGSSFTGATNTFGIGNVNLLAEKTMGKVSFVGQVGFGPRAVEGNGDSNIDGTGNLASTVQQLFVSYSPSESVTFTLGNFGTFVGYEVIDAPANMNYSMSHLFSNGPFYHTGAKVDFSFGEGFGAMVGVFNDTDSKVDVIEGKHFGGQLSYSNDQIGVYLNAITGPETEDVSGEDNLNEFQVDLTATFQASESFMLGLNASSYSTSVDGNNAGGFFGTALYATIATSEDFDFSLRGEYFASTAADGDTSDQPSVIALTASGNFKVGDLRIVPEIRLDSGSNDFHGFGEDDDSAIAFLLAGIYSF